MVCIYNAPPATALDADILDNQNDTANKCEYVEVSDLKQYFSGNLHATKALHLNMRSLPDIFSDI